MWFPVSGKKLSKWENCIDFVRMVGKIWTWSASSRHTTTARGKGRGGGGGRGRTHGHRSIRICAPKMFFVNHIMGEIDWMKPGQEPLAHPHKPNKGQRPSKLL